jgi:hypothetical protein
MIPMPAPPKFTSAYPGLPEGRPARRPPNVRAKAFKAELRRRAQLKAAADVLPHLPGPGESMHALLTGTFDFLLVLTVVIQSRPAKCETLRLATLAFSRRNVAELCRLLDSRLVGRLTLLASDFMARSNASVYQGAIEELAQARGQTIASARCHAKVACLAFADGSRLVFEGSANLRTNKNLEQMTCINDAAIHDWHSSWIDQQVNDAQAQTEAEDEAEANAKAAEASHKRRGRREIDQGGSRQTG